MPNNPMSCWYSHQNEDHRAPMFRATLKLKIVAACVDGWLRGVTERIVSFLFVFSEMDQKRWKTIIFASPKCLCSGRNDGWWKKCEIVDWELFKPFLWSFPRQISWFWPEIRKVREILHKSYTFYFKTLPETGKRAARTRSTKPAVSWNGGSYFFQACFK